MNTTVPRVPGLPLKSRRYMRADFWTLELLNFVSRTAFIVTALLVFASVVGLSLYGYSHADRIYEGVTVSGVSVGGMSEAQARAALEERFAGYLDTKVELQGADQTFTITPREAGASIDSAQTAKLAFQYGRSGSLWNRAQTWVRSAVHGHEVAAVITVDSATLDARLTGLAPQITRAPSDAHVNMTASGNPTIVPEVSGVALDVGGSRGRIIGRFSELSAAPVQLVTPAIAPSVTAGQLEKSLPGAQAAVSSSLALTGNDQSWVVSPEDLKRIVSVNGADGSIQVDERSLRNLIRNIAGEVEHESQDAGLYVTDDGQILTAPAVDAVDLDVSSSVAEAVEALKSGNHSIALKMSSEPPSITDAMAEQAAGVAEELVQNGVTINWSDGSGWLGRADLLAALVIEPKPGEDQPFAFSFDPTVLESRLQPLLDQIYVPAKDAQFRLVDGRVEVVGEAQTGIEVDVDDAVKKVSNAAFGHKTEITLKVHKVKPDYPASYRPKIELNDLLGDSSTYYGTSSEPRRHNVEHAVELENGWLVPPDGIFSYDEWLGNVTKDNGFVTGFGIVADGNTGGVTTAPVVGGGICQVSTTIFQAAFWAGMPIVERWQHPYWLTTYGEPPRGMKGLDAMVNIEEDAQSLDMKFQNTTGDWIAVVVQADGEYVTAQIFGTNPGWDVEVSDPTITNIVTPPSDVRYTDSEELPAGEELQVEHAQDGFDASIHRTVSKDGELVDDLTLESSFAPSRDTFLRGTGSDG
jgi:vancomycin resistance protein YoaR